MTANGVGIATHQSAKKPGDDDLKAPRPVGVRVSPQPPSGPQLPAKPVGTRVSPQPPSGTQLPAKPIGTRDPSVSRTSPAVRSKRTESDLVVSPAVPKAPSKAPSMSPSMSPRMRF